MADNSLEQRQAVSVTKIKFTPGVFAYNASGNVLIELNIVGAPENIQLKTGTNIYDFNDKGNNGDKRANDNIWTLSYPTSLYSFYTATGGFGTLNTRISGTVSANPTLTENQIDIKQINNEIVVETSEPVTNLLLYDVSGKLVHAVNNLNSINIQDVPKGSYVVKVVTSTQTSSKMMILN
jgi:hypothetical protein